MSWGSNVARVLKAVTRTTAPVGGGGGISITGSQHVDNSVNTNITAGDNSFNEDKSTTLGPGAVQSNTTSTQTATGGGSLAKDSVERSQEGVQAAIAAAPQVGQDAFMSQDRSGGGSSSGSSSPGGMSKPLIIGGAIVGVLIVGTLLVVAMRKGK